MFKIYKQNNNTFLGCFSC